jgi:hypothetical protein
MTSRTPMSRISAKVIFADVHTCMSYVLRSARTSFESSSSTTSEKGELWQACQTRLR